MKKVIDYFLKDKKLLTETIIFIAILGTYFGFAITQNIQSNNSSEQLRQYNKEHSPSVCDTSSDERYHNYYRLTLQKKKLFSVII